MRFLMASHMVTHGTDVSTGRPRTTHPAHRSVATWCAAAAFAVLILVLAARFAVYLDFVIRSILYPFELDYGEGIVWQQALLIPGQSMYGDIRHFPFIVFHYPPVYHLAVRAIAFLGSDYLIAGRGLSVLSALSIGALTAGLTFSAVRERTSRAASIIGAAIAGLITFTYWPFAVWSPLMRVDMLAIALDFLGIYYAVRSRSRPWLLYLALIMFVLAVYTKQTSVAAPLATLPIFLLVMPRQTTRAICFGLALGAAILLLLTWWTDGGFIHHVFLYNINRYSAKAAIIAVLQQGRYAIYLALAIAAVVVGWQEIRNEARAGNQLSFRQRLAQSTGTQLLMIFMLYLAISTGMLVMLGKSGWASNYLIEWMCVWSVLIGMLVTPAAETVLNAVGGRSDATPTVLVALVPALLLLQVLLVPGPHDRGLGTAIEIRQQEQLVEMVRVANKPVASDDMVLLLKAGKEVPWEPAIFTELASTGRWDEQPLVDMIKSRAFAFIITRGHRGERLFDSRHTKAVIDAIDAAYPRTEQVAKHVLHLPPD